MNLIEYYSEKHKFIPIEEVYPECTKSSFYVSDYTPLLESFRFPIAVRIDQNDYQGDSWVLFHNPNNNKLGYLCFGWGSCSGCDSLQACSSIEDIRELQQDLYDKTIWFNSINEARVFFKDHDWKGDYSWYYQEFKDFITEAKEYISNLNEGANL